MKVAWRKEERKEITHREREEKKGKTGTACRAPTGTGTPENLRSVWTED
jgi:hypothetical protein